MSLLSIKSLSLGIGSRKLLAEVGFDVAEGDFVLVAGSNGAGKTTLLKCIMRLEDTWEGSILFNGCDMREMDRMSMARCIAYLPQRLDNLPDFSVLHFMNVCRYAWQDSDIAPVKEAASTLGICDLLERALPTLSGGELQKVLIASALAQRPRLMLLDEPTASLDPLQKSEMAILLKKLAHEGGMGVLMVSHDVQSVASAVDYVIPMKEGRSLSACPPADFLANMESIYL